jgi:hypothetical protein
MDYLLAEQGRVEAMRDEIPGLRVCNFVTGNGDNYSDDDLIPADEQNRLMACRDAMRRIEFEVGDIANKLMADNIVAGRAVSNKRIMKAVGRFCGKSASTVKYYAENALFYDSQTRDEYDILPFSVLDMARSFGDIYREVLEYAMLNPYLSANDIWFHFARKRFVDAVEEEREYDAGDNSANIRRFDVLPKTGPANGLNGEYSQVYESVSDNSAIGAIATLDNLIDSVERILASIEITGNLAVEVKDALTKLRRCIPLIMASLLSMNKS